MLDRPVPTPKILQQLAEDDYQLAETIYAGSIFAVLIFFAQQGVRVYKHCVFMPDSLCPFDGGAWTTDRLLELF